MNTPLNDLLADLNDLNEKTYELCCRHRRNADKISDSLNEEIDKAIAFEYTNHLEVHKNELIDAVTTTLYVLDQIHQQTTPVKKRRWYWPWSFKRSGTSKEIDEAIEAQETSEQLLCEVLDTVEDMKLKFLRHLKNLSPDGAACDEPAETSTAQSGPNEEWENERHDTLANKVSANTSKR